MAEEIKHWEYRVQTVGGVFNTKDEEIQATLDEWGARGRLGGRQCVCYFRERPGDDRRQAPANRARPAHEVDAADGNRPLKRDQQPAL